MVTVTNIKKHSAGDQIKVIADLASIGNGETWIVPHLTNIEDIALTCSTAAALGATVSGHTVAFAAGSSLAGKIAVYGR